MVDLNTLIPAESSLQLTAPLAINDRGEIAGMGVPSGCSPQDDGICGHAFLPTLAEEETANAINDAGEIVGAAAFSTQPHDAYLWKDGTATDLGHLNGDCSSEGWAINSAGQIAAISFSCDGANFRATLGVRPMIKKYPLAKAAEGYARKASILSAGLADD